ncbi:recombinase family protein [Arthrobacter sulfonylureivorans]|uniref:Recombinase family protein n=1 Tax=Arthrobacter sulfonylureivorans TaxID=2486855 RepID=A0ABY3WD10_9MICC|nr:recombinase family protein [Arthrobacter sulfonylureivorans]UNK47088.1 recombinase family protein [Arthrobacter sulfonylureivorans]
MTRRAFIYTRISQDRTAEGLGVQRQEEVCRDYAMSHGLDVVEVFSDNDVSAFSGRRRRSYEAMLERLRAGSAEAVVCWRMDRLHRQPIELEEYANVCRGERGASPILTYAVTAGGEIDLSTADGLLRAGIMGQVARFESDTKRERARAKALQKAQAGEWQGGARPFGWQIDGKRLVLDRVEADALASAHHDVLAGRSLGSIIRDWNDPDREGGPLLTSVGKPWGYAQLRQVLLRARNAGLYEFNGEIMSRDKIPPIVSEDVWRGVCTVLKAPERRRSQSNKAAHLLAGIAQCQCGEPVRSATVTGRADKETGAKPKYTVYRCPAKGPGHVGKREEYVDAVVEIWIMRLLGQAYREEPEDPDVLARAERLRAELEALRMREEEGGRLLAFGEMLPSKIAAFNEAIRRQRAGLEEQLAALGLGRGEELDPLQAFNTEMANVHQRLNAWLALPLDDRRDFIRSRLHIVLHSHDKGSSRVFDPDTVSVHVKSKREARRTLTASEILDLPRTTLDVPNAPDDMFEPSHIMVRRWIDSRVGSTYDPRRPDRQRFAALEEEYPS